MDIDLIDISENTVYLDTELKNNTVTIDAELIRLYSYSQAMSIRGVVALKLNVTRDGQEETLFVRGYSSKTNWAGKREKYGTAANLAAVDLMSSLVLLLQDTCSQA